MANKKNKGSAKKGRGKRVGGPGPKPKEEKPLHPAYSSREAEKYMHKSVAEIFSWEAMEAELENDPDSVVLAEYAKAGSQHIALMKRLLGNDYQPTTVPMNLLSEVYLAEKERGDQEAQEGAVVCRHWQQGYCCRGSDCWFAHPDEEKGVYGRREGIEYDSWR